MLNANTRKKKLQTITTIHLTNAAKRDDQSASEGETEEKTVKAFHFFHQIALGFLCGGIERKRKYASWFMEWCASPCEKTRRYVAGESVGNDRRVYSTGKLKYIFLRCATTPTFVASRSFFWLSRSIKPNICGC